MWVRDDIPRAGGILYQWILRNFPFGPILLGYHDGCCKDEPQRVWQLTIEALKIRKEPLHLAKDADDAKSMAVAIVRSKLNVLRELADKLMAEASCRPPQS